LFQPAFDSGTGLNYFPVITYADFCFMRAELAALGITTDDAEEFYEEGVTASINWYNDVAIGAGLTNYTAVTPAEITDYLAEPGVAFDAGKAVEQIACQAFLNDFRQPAEGWSVWRRTGFPNTTSVFAVTDMKTSGVSLPIPRRAPLSELIEGTPNYANKKAAYDAMALDPNFGAGPNDAFGRVWWDRP
jgi:hypothetical protein